VERSEMMADLSRLSTTLKSSLMLKLNQQKKNLSSFTHPHLVTKPWDFLFCGTQMFNILVTLLNIMEINEDWA